MSLALFQPLYRGDDLPGITSIALSNDDTEEAIPATAAVAQLQNADGRGFYDWPTVVSGGLVSLPGVSKTVTIKWPVGTHRLLVQITNALGAVTYIEAPLVVKGGIK